MSFPTAASTGIPYEHYDELPRDFGGVTDSWEYEDGGMDFNRRTLNPAREWSITFRGGLTKAQTDQFDTFWETNGTNVTFDFLDKYSVLWTGVRIKTYSRSHEAHKAWSKTVSFTLVQFPT